MASPSPSASASPDAPAACVWRGDFGSGHSLAVVNDGIVGALEAAGVGVERLLPADPPSPEAIVGVAQHWPPTFSAPSAGPFVLYQPWEFGEAPARWVEEIRSRVDEVWTPSEASRRTYVAAGIDPSLVQVMPNGVDTGRFTADGPAHPLPTAKGAVFLFVGGTTYRKGIDLLFDAYARAFRRDDDVCLVIKCFGADTVYRGQTAEQAIGMFSRLDGAPEVVLLDEELGFDAMPALYRAADVVVQPYRGEGFCLPALEALACGRPVIVTAGGSTDDFVTDACGWRIPSRPVPLPEGSLPPHLQPAGDGFYLESDRDALAAALREATDPAARGARAARAREHAERFTWAAAGEKARARLEALAGRTPVRTIAPALVPERRRVLFAAVPDWERPDTWSRPLLAYAEAFGPDDDTTLLLPAGDETGALALVSAELESAGHDPAAIADVVLAEPGSTDPVAVELAADAIICANGYRPSRARLALPPDPAALRAAAAAR